MAAREQVYRARWIVPVSSAAIENGWVRVRNGRVVEIGRGKPPHPHRDFGDVAILPALVNAHTHLEFSDLQTPIGTPGMPLPTWIGRVIAHRAEANQSLEKRTASLLAGLAESHVAGVGLIGEIATRPWLEESWRVRLSEAVDNQSRTGPDVIRFAEVLGFSAAAQQHAQQWTERLVDSTVDVNSAAELTQRTSEATTWLAGYSPHAPYSTPLELVRWAVKQAAQRRLPVAMHLAESLEELELLHNGTGLFREVLTRVGVWREGLFPQARGIGEYLEILAMAPRSLVIHGNYLTTSEIDRIANQPQMSIVYCPRTHHYFRHAAYPLLAMLERGVRVVLGTDSRASNPCLSIWQEAVFVANNFARLAPEKLLRMITHDAAIALGQPNYGTITLHQPARFIQVPTQSSQPGALFESLFSQTPTPI
ncbi:amidohydrolase family protein [Planctomycetaceae bacterium SH139]